PELLIPAIVGAVRDRDLIILADAIATGGSILELLKHLRANGARCARVACTHGMFCSGAVARLAAEPDITEIVCTNTLPNASRQPHEKLRILSVAPALAEAMRRINNGASVSALFDEPVRSERSAA